MEKAPKIYVGSGKMKETSYGPLLKLSFNQKDLETLQANLNEKGYVNLNCNERKEEGKYGETHSMTIDTWKPEAQSGIMKNKYPTQEIDPKDIPF